MSFVIDYQNKVVMVTGVSSGIGRGVAVAFAKAGAHVVGCSRKAADDELIKGLAAEVEAEGVGFLYVQADVTKDEDLNCLVDQTIARFGKLNVLVSSAGVNVFVNADICPEDKWEYNLNLNLKSHWKLSTLCKPYLVKEPDAAILLMTSNHAFSTIPGCFPYNVAKTAITGLVRSLAIEWGPAIRVVGIAPGFVDTGGNDAWFESFPDPAAERQRTYDLHPVKKIGSVEEVGSLCVFLGSPEAGFICGTTILMDGGRSALMQDS